MSLRLVDGELVQTPEVANYQETRIASLGRRLVKNAGGHIESKGNYGSNNVCHHDADGTVMAIENPRSIKFLTK